MADVFRRWLQGQQIVWPILCAAIGQTLCNILLNYVLVDVYDMGFQGAAFVVALTKWCYLYLLVSIIIIREVYVKHEARSHPIISPPFGPFCVRILSLNNLASKAEEPVFKEDISQLYASIPDHENILPVDTAKRSNKITEGNKKLKLHSNREARPEIEDITPMKSVAPTTDLNLPPIQPAVFDHWGQFYQLGLPGALSLFIEWLVLYVFV